MDMKYALAGAFDLEDANMTKTENEATFPTLDLITVNAKPDEGDEGMLEGGFAHGLHVERIHRRRHQRSALLNSLRNKASSSQISAVHFNSAVKPIVDADNTIVDN